MFPSWSRMPTGWVDVGDELVPDSEDGTVLGTRLVEDLDFCDQHCRLYLIGVQPVLESSQVSVWVKYRRSWTVVSWSNPSILKRSVFWRKRTTVSVTDEYSWGSTLMVTLLILLTETLVVWVTPSSKGGGSQLSKSMLYGDRLNIIQNLVIRSFLTHHIRSLLLFSHHHTTVGTEHDHEKRCRVSNNTSYRDGSTTDNTESYRSVCHMQLESTVVNQEEQDSPQHTTMTQDWHRQRETVQGLIMTWIVWTVVVVLFHLLFYNRDRGFGIWGDTHSNVTNIQDFQEINEKCTHYSEDLFGSPVDPIVQDDVVRGPVCHRQNPQEDQVLLSGRRTTVSSGWLSNRRVEVCLCTIRP